MATPTNDAPVTVEQCDREAAADWYGAHAPRTASYEDMCQRFARHRLAALASAPAEDGDAIREALLVVRGSVSDLRKGFAKSVDPARWVEQVVAHIDTALARPRAAVGEREAQKRAIRLAMNPHGYLGEQCVEDILTALQSPTAKENG